MGTTGQVHKQSWERKETRQVARFLQLDSRGKWMYRMVSLLLQLLEKKEYLAGCLPLSFNLTSSQLLCFHLTFITFCSPTVSFIVPILPTSIPIYSGVSGVTYCLSHTRYISQHMHSQIKILYFHFRLNNQYLSWYICSAFIKLRSRSYSQKLVTNKHDANSQK